MNTSNISSDKKIDLNKIISEFIQYVNEDSPEISTDPNIVRVKVIKPEGCGWSRDIPSS